MDNFKAMAVFAETVAAGSMSAAAKRLGMSASAVSQTITTLEAQHGMTLLHRSTRKLGLTEVGERYYVHCRRFLDAANAATESLELARGIPTGELRMAAPVGFSAQIVPALAHLLSEAPQLRLRLLLADAMIDLIDAGVDVALRVGSLESSNWVARHLCDFEFVLCAAPSYLKRRKAPIKPEDLSEHEWLALELEPSSATLEHTFTAHAGTVEPRPAGVSTGRFHGSQGQLDLHRSDGQHRRVQVDARIVSNNQSTLQQMCEAGLGIGRFALADVLPSLQHGSIVRVLNEWSLRALPVWALTPRRESEEAKVRIAIEFMKRHFSALTAPAPGAR